MGHGNWCTSLPHFPHFGSNRSIVFQRSFSTRCRPKTAGVLQESPGITLQTGLCSPPLRTTVLCVFGSPPIHAQSSNTNPNPNPNPKAQAADLEDKRPWLLRERLRILLVDDALPYRALMNLQLWRRIFPHLTRLMYLHQPNTDELTHHYLETLTRAVRRHRTSSSRRSDVQKMFKIKGLIFVNDCVVC